MREKSLLRFKLPILLLAIALLLPTLLVTEARAEELYAGTYTADDIQDICETYMDEILEMSDEDLDYLADQAVLYGAQAQFVVDYAAVKDAAGAFVGYGDFSVSEVDGVVSAVQVVEFQNGKYDFNFSYDYINQSVSNTLTESAVGSTGLGAKMSKAAMNTMMGLFTVFLVLFVMVIIISAFKFIAPQPGTKDKEPAPAFEAQVEQREAANRTDDAALIAVIAAAISAATGQATDSFVVRSIKRR